MAVSIIKAEVGSWITAGNASLSASDTVETILTRDIMPSVMACENGVYCLSNSWPTVAGGWSAIVSKSQQNTATNPSITGIFGQYQKLYYFRGFVSLSTGAWTAEYIHQVTMSQIFPT